jgi:trigger factor
MLSIDFNRWRKTAIMGIVVKHYKGVEVTRIKNAVSEKKAEMLIREAILDKILDANDIDIPQNVIDEEASQMAMEKHHQMKYESLAGNCDFDYLYPQEEDMNELKEEACKCLKTEIILRGIIDAERFEVTMDELETAAQDIADREKITLEMVKDFLGENLEALRNDLLIRKALDFIYDNAVIQM